MAPTRPVNIEALRDALQLTCIEHGDYTLSSGEKSNYYYDGKRLTLHPLWAVAMGELFTDLVVESGADAVGGMEIGSVPIAQTVSVLALQRESREVPVFVVRKERKEHGTKDKIAAAYINPETPLLQRGTKVAIVDDVVTKGGSIDKAIQAVEQLGCEIVLVAVVVERHEGGGRLILERGYNFRRLFYTDSSGNLFIDESVASRYSGVPAGGVSPR